MEFDGLHEGPDRQGPMGIQTVPDDDGRLPELPDQDGQEVLDRLGIDVGVGVHSKVEVHAVPGRGRAQRRDDRDLVVGPPLLVEHGRVARRPLGPPEQRGHREADFVDEDQPGVQSAGFFLMRGQSFSTHCRMPSSFRSRSRLVGFCGLKPRESRRRPTWYTW